MLVALLVALPLAAAAAVLAAKWKPLAKDGLHDPDSPAMGLLQEPAEALSVLPPDPGVGNQVRWVQALEEGKINPRSNLFESTKVRVYDKDVYLSVGSSQPIVRFPHRQHTLWLDCANCHEHLFKSEAGGTRISMLAILEGEQCGQCHGAVAFPLTECLRCHSVPQGTQLPPDAPKAGPAVRKSAAPGTGGGKSP